MTRDAATQAQVDAARPDRSTWLSANAGSGKTRVLTDRVARLLLEGVEPQNILCLTYTKAAASEMQNRLFKRLGGWAMLDEPSLRAELSELGAERIPDLATARTLFARAIETPGGLKIQTIHSFCSSILRRFPLEAGVSPQFREIEDREQELLREDVLDAMSRGADAPVVRDTLRVLGASALDGLSRTIMHKADSFATGWDEAAMRDLLDISPEVTTDSLMATVFGRDNAEILRDLITVCQTSGPNDQKAATRLANIDFDAPNAKALLTCQSLFLFGKTAKAPLGAKIDAFPTKPLRTAYPDLTDALNDLMQLVETTRETFLALAALDRARTLHAFAARFIPAYRARKMTAGVLDFDDLITKTRDLLTDPKVAQWVLFRLDGGIDHVLVDEAQDTSPTQWEVVRLLTEEFAAGVGAREDVERTVFVVGDKKQSIYSFQGADPEAFDRMRDYFKGRMEAAGKTLQERELLYSFRSSAAILRVVDETFVGDLGEGLGKVGHLAFKSGLPGRVDLWPPVPEPEKRDDSLPWDSPVDEVAEDAPDVQLANRIAAEICRMKREETLPVETRDGLRSRPVTEGDILILVRSRKSLFHEIIRACKAANLDIAGADRMEVGQELAVKDIKALLAFLALPEDDLSLACVLRSPLFGWTEQELYTLAHHRPDKTYLWAALRESTRHPETLAMLGDLLKQADFLRPYDLMERILTRHDGRRRLIARLGQEAEDGIDALLGQALSYEATAVPSLTSFLTWLDTDAMEVKRQMDAQGNRIRVMTMHGAKGLEAPIVIVPQTRKRKEDHRGTILSSPAGPMWKMSKDGWPDAIASLVEEDLAAERRESMRLLYVAMTRAEKWLIVAGAGDVGEEPTDSWYNIVANGIEHAGARDAMAGQMKIRRVQSDNVDWDLPPQVSGPDKTGSSVALPIFMPLAQIPPARTLSPSDLEGAKIVPGDPAGDDRDAALARGRMVHMLLEHLAPVPDVDRRALAASLLSSDVDADAVTPELIDDALGILSNPALAPIFGPGTLAEVGITASLPALHDRRIHGAIDRLVIEADRVLAVDFKTNRIVPSTPEDTPEGLLRQMGAYAAALAQIYPQHRIDTAILWTQTAELMILSPALVQAALSRVPPP